MEKSLGLLKITVLKGVNLAIRDSFSRSSDPYVVIKSGRQVKRTKPVKKNLNPVWNEELTLSINNPCIPIKLEVYDKDYFSRDDKMGDAEFDIEQFVEALKREMDNVPTGTTITKVIPNRQNCLAEESRIVWENGQVIQHLFLRLRNVECGEIQLQLKWTNISGSNGLRINGM